MKTQLARYPQEYSLILQKLQPGIPIEVKMPNAMLAQRERLQYYNFLKWCRRNPNSVPHLGNRYNEVVISCSDNILRFELRNSARMVGGISEAFAAALGELPTDIEQPLNPIPEGSKLDFVPDINPAPEDFEQAFEALKPKDAITDPFGHFLRGEEKK